MALATSRFDFSRGAIRGGAHVFRLVSPRSANGTLKATPSPRSSRITIPVTIFVLAVARSRDVDHGHGLEVGYRRADFHVGIFGDKRINILTQSYPSLKI